MRRWAQDVGYSVLGASAPSGVSGGDMKAVVSGEKFISPIVKVLLLLRRQRVAGQGGNRESSPEPMSPCNGGDRGGEWLWTWLHPGCSLKADNFYVGGWGGERTSKEK